jgi:hypothetical protein
MRKALFSKRAFCLSRTLSDMKLPSRRYDLLSH